MRRQFLVFSFLAAMLAVAPLQAQTPSPAGKDGGPPRAMKNKGRDCSKASDPKACEERQAKIREAYKKAEESCKGKDAAERRSCMAEQMCAQAPDPAKCRERGAKQNEQRQKLREAQKKAEESCKGKEAADRRACMSEQMCAQAPDPAKCRERGAKQNEQRQKLREAHKKAEESCKGKEGADRRSCMSEQMCAQAPDPAKCREREKQRGERKGPQK